jgi:hypothetical protein
MLSQSLAGKVSSVRMHSLDIRLLADHAHVFFVHSSITEILAHRITDSIAGRGIGNSRFLYVIGRNYKHSLLPDSATCKLDDNSRWLIGYEHHRGNIFDFERAFRDAKVLVKDLRTYTLYTPHAKLRIARALIVNKKCLNYYVYEEGLLSHLCPKSLKNRFSNYVRTDYTLKDKLYVLKIKIRSLLYFLFSGRTDVWRPVWFYLFGCYSNPAGLFFFCRSKYAGILCLLQEAFPGQHTNKFLFSVPTNDERALLHHLYTNYRHLVGVPILLVHCADSPQDIASSLQKMRENNSQRFILRPHPSLLQYSFSEVCHIKQIDHKLMITDSSILLNYPLEMLVEVLSPPLINQGSSSISLYTKIYSKHVHFS